MEFDLRTAEDELMLQRAVAKFAVSFLSWILDTYPLLFLSSDYLPIASQAILMHDFDSKSPAFLRPENRVEAMSG